MRRARVDLRAAPRAGGDGAPRFRRGAGCARSRRFWLRTVAPGLLGGAALLAAAGCPATTALGVTEEQAFDNAPPLSPFDGLSIDCYDSLTGRYYADCPRAILETRLATVLLSPAGGLPDNDGDGIPNEFDPDIDGDGQPNRYDFDIDGDGLPNGSDPDPDDDGKVGRDDPDEDGDGLCDRFDLNDDGDGLFDDEEAGGGKSKSDDDDDDDDDEDDDDDDEDDLDDLLERQRDGTLTKNDRDRIAEEINDRLNDNASRQAIREIVERLVSRSQAPEREAGRGPAAIVAVDTLYGQLRQALQAARQAANLRPNAPTPERVLRIATEDFVPRAKVLDALSDTFKGRSIPELGQAVNDLRSALNASERLLSFAGAIRRLENGAGPDAEARDLRMILDGARILGSAFDTTSGKDLFDAISLLHGEAGSAERLEVALRDMVALREEGRTFEEARDETLESLIRDNNAP
jgi:hypothetical protein